MRKEKLSRRAALSGGLALAPAAAMAAVPTIDTDRDAELIALGREFDVARAIEQSLDDEDDAFIKAQDHTVDMADKIAALPAYTFPGLQAKGRALHWLNTQEDAQTSRLYEDLVSSLINDLVREAVS